MSAPARILGVELPGGVEEGAHLVGLAIYAGLEAPGRPESWGLDPWGRPLWLLQLPLSNLEASWGVIVPSASNPPPELGAALALDRERQGLGRWGANRSREELERVLAVGPAAMPAITWETLRPRRRGHPGVRWNDVELARCAAWLVDIRGRKQKDLEKQLFGLTLPPFEENSNRSARRQLVRYINSGRQALCDEGVWPWVAVPLDRVDDDDAESELVAGWWQDEEVLAHLEVWYRCAQLEAPERRRLIALAVPDHAGHPDQLGLW